MAAGPLAGLRIGLVTASASRLGGGVFEAVAAQAAMIRSLGGEVVVAALRDEHSEADRARLGTAGTITCDVKGPRQVGFAPQLLPALLGADLDCLHLHGIWMYPSAAASAWARHTRRPYFVSPHGMLDPWITARGKWKKAIARLVYERTSWHRASALHALTAREGADIARESGRTDSLVVPNAGPAAAAATSAYPAPVVVYIGRIHAKKNLVALVEGWMASTRPAGARLLIAGWGDDAAVAELRAATTRGDGTAEFLGPVFGAAKEDLLARARFVILPSHSEGLPMAMLEAWARGIPTLMTGECNLPEGFAQGAAMDCGYDPATIATSLSSALALDGPAWSAMAASALGLARGSFSPAAVAARWGEIYARAVAAARFGGETA
ncbi:glycosyltransferase [Novosphingobium flavum]|uniref:Glycosyltransferase n=1 Tax=Novosphingobium flavum TaxID=1778672 RepID=A0A7X1KKN8_9SPHN|nr:glycosyltransferase [Novosphingobium flavum]MBC2664453.1 glycosyltransferase [Novosphingobium flavum]